MESDYITLESKFIKFIPLVITCYTHITKLDHQLNQNELHDKMQKNRIDFSIAMLFFSIKSTTPMVDDFFLKKFLLIST